jgi:NAD(P)-dependent dehydrogenase (short-subunit alcohol dehydrogenase family)
VLLSSIGHKLYVKGWDLADLHWRQRAYVPFLAYGASKMANLLMAKELAKRWGRQAAGRRS